MKKDFLKPKENVEHSNLQKLMRAYRTAPQGSKEKNELQKLIDKFKGADLTFKGGGVQALSPWIPITEEAEDSKLDVNQQATNKVEQATANLDLMWRNIFISLGLPAETIKSLKPQLVSVVVRMLQDATKKDLENKNKAAVAAVAGTDKVPVEEASVAGSIAGYSVKKNNPIPEESIIRR